MQLVVPIAVKNAVSAATITFTASSTIRCFFIIHPTFCVWSIYFSPLGGARGGLRSALPLATEGTQEREKLFACSDHP